MSKRFIASVTLFSFLSLGAPAFANNTTAGSVAVEGVQGEVVLRGSSSNTPVSGNLSVGDSVKVGPESQLTIVLSDGSRVRVSPNSEFRLTKDANGSAQLYLLTGKVMAAVSSRMEIQTYRSNAVATTGEFVLESTPSETGLRVFSGDAQMKSSGETETSFTLLGSLPQTPDTIAAAASLAFGRLASEQVVANDVAFGAQGKGKKGGGIRDAQVEESTGGVGEVSPDQDMAPPGKEPATVVETTPEPPATPPTAPPTAPAPPPAAAATGGGLGTGAMVGIGLGAAGLVALLVTALDDDDNNNNNFGPVPSPSLP